MKLPEFKLKRVYEPPTAEDGLRLLVDRLWPRGISKERGQIDRWAKDLAPSHDLRRRFHHDPEQWEAFLAAYFEELDQRPGAVAEVMREGATGRVTLVYASKNLVQNNAVALKLYLDSRKA